MGRLAGSMQTSGLQGWRGGRSRIGFLTGQQHDPCHECQLPHAILALAWQAPATHNIPCWMDLTFDSHQGYAGHLRACLCQRIWYCLYSRLPNQVM